MTAQLRFGIVQGRLTRSPPGELQWFPQDRWRDEFALAAQVGADYIELIAERCHNPDNPLWSDSGNDEIKVLAAENGLSLHALCNDFVIGHALPGDKDVLQQNFDLIRRGARLGCEKYVLPLFEHSELTAGNGAGYAESLCAIADAAHDAGMTVCLETILTGDELIGLIDRLGHDNIKVVYDTGNRVAFGHDLAGDIRKLKDRITHVHIKDKNTVNENVILGTGLVNFQAVFEALADIGYGGPYTFETQRGHDPLRTARYNIGLVEYFNAEATHSL